jgi:LPS sulfotransferase NodH
MDAGRTQAPTVGIIGSGRSGSTLLEFLLAKNLASARPVGELETLVVRGPRDNEICSCLLPAQDCPMWTSVLRQLTDDPELASWEAVVEQRATRTRWAFAVVASALVRRVAGRPGAGGTHVACYAPVRSALATLSRGSAVVIDNSKTPLHFFALAAGADLDLRVVHLLRRPHAVVWSWKRRKHLPESGSQNWYMEPRSAVASTARWASDAIFAALFHFAHPEVGYVRVSYEALCADPDGTVAACARALDLPVATLARDDLSYHVLGGNPARFGGGLDHVILDDEWRARMSATTRVMINVLAMPLYHFLLRKSSRR